MTALVAFSGSVNGARLLNFFTLTCSVVPTEVEGPRAARRDFARAAGPHKFLRAHSRGQAQDGASLPARRPLSGVRAQQRVEVAGVELLALFFRDSVLIQC